MQLLSDVIEKSKRLANEETQRVQSLGQPLNEEWEKVKDFIDSLSNKTDQVISTYLMKNRRAVVMEKIGMHHKGGKVCGDLNRIAVNLENTNGHEVQCTAYECTTCGIFKSWYAIFNKELSTCYRRVLLG